MLYTKYSGFFTIFYYFWHFIIEVCRLFPEDWILIMHLCYEIKKLTKARVNEIGF